MKIPTLTGLSVDDEPPWMADGSSLSTRCKAIVESTPETRVPRRRRLCRSEEVQLIGSWPCVGGSRILSNTRVPNLSIFAYTRISPRRGRSVEYRSYMLIEIKIESRDPATDLAELWEWLDGEPKLRALLHKTPRRMTESELGTVWDAISIAVGSGGVLTVLARSLSTWLKSRRGSVMMTIKTPSREIKIDIQGTRDPLPAIQELLRIENDE
jgi:hypothetical protein